MQSIITGFDNAMEVTKGALSALFEPMKVFFDIFSNFWLGAALIIVVFLIFLISNIVRDGAAFSKLIKRPQTLAICSMMIAINVILGYFTLNFSSYLRIGFGFVTLPVVTMLFGPIAGCITGILQDVVSFILKPTGGYLFTLTLNVGISGMIYGVMLYKRKITFARVFITKLIIIVVVNIILNSIGLAPTVGSGLAGILPSRVVKNIILLPVQSVVVYAILKTVNARVRHRIGAAG